MTIPAEPKRDDFGKALHDLREAQDIIKAGHKEFDTYKALNDARYTELEKTAFAQEEKNQALVAEKAKEEKAKTEATERLDLLEKRFSRGNVGNAKEVKEGINALQSFLTKGYSPELVIECKTLRTDINENGGFLTKNPEILEEIIKDITEISPIRQLARVRRTASQSLEVRRRKSLLNSEWKGQLETSDTDHSKYGMIEIVVNKLPITVDATREMLLYDDVSIMNEIMQDHAEDAAENEGFAFVLGDGSKKPEGFLVNEEVVAGAITSTSTGVVDGDDFSTLMTSLKVGYNPVFGFNRTVWGQIVNLKDSGGQYLINFGDLSAGINATLRGVPYRIIQDMPNAASGNLAVVCADFNKGYVVVDGMNVEIIRDDFTRKKEGVVEFQFNTFVGGKVVQPEAIAVLSIKS